MLKKSFFLLLICVCCMGFQIPTRIVKKADALIAKFLETEAFEKEVFIISESLNAETPSDFSKENLFSISSEGKHLGYGYIGNARSKTATFDYLVLFDTNFIITKSKVLIYREEYGGEIGSKRWLKQFTGAAAGGKELAYNQDIIPISGATISVQSMTRAMNDLLQSIGHLQKNNQF